MLPTFPSRYWFTIGLPGVFSLAGWSPRIRTGLHVSRPTQVPPPAHDACLYGSVTLSGPTFQTVPVHVMNSSWRPYNPSSAVTPLVWALPLSIATTQGIDIFFLFLRVLRCFSSPRSPRNNAVTGLQPAGLPIRTPPDHNLFAVTRRFSQLTASFIASRSLGIHRSLLYPSLFVL